MTIKLKPDNSILRYPDRDAREEPVDPLTHAEKERLSVALWKDCRAAYKRRMVSSGLLADYEESGELDGEAYIFMWNILGKFDKSKCGKIAEFDIEGATNPKTLEFYFKIYFSGRVNFVACEARDYKKKRGIGPKGSVSDVSYDEESEGHFSEIEYEYEATGHFFEGLQKRSDDFKRFAVQSMIVQVSQKELREEFGPNFNKLKSELTKFKNDLKKKHLGSFLRETGKI
jgi:hypothetical protein